MRKIAPFFVAALLVAGCASTAAPPAPGAAAGSPSPIGKATTSPSSVYYNSYGIEKLGATEGALAHIDESNQVLEKLGAGYFDTPIRLTNSPQPVMSMEALREGIEGTVVVDIAFGGSGKVTSVQVLQSPSVLLTKAVLDAVWGWTITPPMHKGKPSSISAKQSFTFHMEH